MRDDFALADASAIAAAVRSRQISALEITRAALDRIRDLDVPLNAFTEVLPQRALREAAQIDDAIAHGIDPGPLAGVPFAVKNLFDMKGIPTLAGSIIRATAPPPGNDAATIASLRAAGAVLTGALNMDEFAYGFTTENSHYGATHNPHDLSRVAGGSSGGSAAAVAGGLVPLTLGSDTNGSIRVPASFCGIFGLKPTYGRVSRTGSFLFVGSIDCLGPFARSVRDLSVAFDAMQGPDPRDPVCSTKPAVATLPELEQGIGDLRIAVADGYFRQAGNEALEAVDLLARALGTDRTLELPEAARARAAAYVITASEGGNQHLADLRAQAARFDPLTRNRFLAGALVPAAWVSFAQRFRSWYREQLREVFRHVDVILAPATPCSAITIGQQTITANGAEVPARPNIGVFTQPISFVGLPVVAVPVHVPGRMPIGVQLIGAPFQEAKLLRTARALEAAAVVSAPVARNFMVEALK